MTAQPLIFPLGMKCPHPKSSLAGTFLPGEDGQHMLSVLCRSCGGLWNQDTVPLPVIEQVIEMLERGETTPLDRPAGL